MTKTLIIYHADCWDGMASAWVATQAFPKAALYPGTHQEAAPDVTGKDVYIIDFSYKRPILNSLISQAKSLYVIDHHDTAQKELAGLENCTFDLMKSGSGLAWDYFFPDKERPWVINYVEDQDLWNFKLTESRALNAAISAHPRTLDTFIKLAATTWDIEDPDGEINQLIKMGTPIVQYREQLVQRIVKHAQMIKFDGYDVPIVNTAILQSEVGGRLAENHPFSLTWFYQKGVYTYSLRSKEIDVGAIAVKHGGGGHPRSSGFRLDYLLT